MQPSSSRDGSSWRTTVRAADCDWFGHANNAIYADYVISAAISAWGADHGAARWRMSSIEMDFKSPVTHGDEIEVVSWAAGRRNGSIRSVHRIGRPGVDAVVAEAVVTWSAPDNDTPAPWAEDPPEAPARLRSTPAKPNRPDAYLFRRSLRVQPYEADHSGLVNPTWVFRWGWASMFAATSEVGWPQERMLAAGFMSYQRHRSAELLESLHPGDEVEVQSRLYDLHRIRGTWEHRFLRDGAVVAIDRAEGAFLNGSGRIGPPPEGLMESLIAGHDAGATDGPRTN